MKSLAYLLSAFTLVGLVLVTASCDPSGVYEYHVKNMSDSVLYVVSSNQEEPEPATLILEPGTSELIYECNTINGVQDEGDDFLKFFNLSGIFLDADAEISVKKDVRLRESWKYKGKDSGSIGRSGTNIYTITITNDDLK